jgi:hypothetical protein
MEQLDWLTDAALFIDASLVEQVYDAFVRPEFQIIHQQTEHSEETRTQLNAQIKLSSEIKAPLWLKSFLGVDVGGKIETGGELENNTGNLNRNLTHEAFITNPQRKIEELTVHYLNHYPKRIRSIILEKPLGSNDELLIERSPYLLQTPRVLAFLDLPPKTKLIPTAIEFDNNKIELVYKTLAKKWGWKEGKEILEHYPDDPNKSKTEQSDELKAYWDDYDAAYDAKDAMVAIEQAAQENGKIRWIDFRLKLTEAGDTMHLHISPRADYDTGVFGYNFIKRGYKHGLRIVGTLKSEPDMNVMAIYEK